MKPLVSCLAANCATSNARAVLHMSFCHSIQYPERINKLVREGEGIGYPSLKSWRTSSKFSTRNLKPSGKPINLLSPRLLLSACNLLPVTDKNHFTGKEDPSLLAEIFTSRRGPGFFLYQYNNMKAIVYEFLIPVVVIENRVFTLGFFRTKNLYY